MAEAGGAPGDVCALAVAQEEITFARRAHDRVLAASRTSRSWSTSRSRPTQPGIDEKELGRHRFGSGPVLTRGSTLDPAVFELLHETAEAEGIPFTVDGVARARPAPTPTRSTSRAAASRRGVVSVPLRYMHSPVEMVQLDDVENAARLIAAFARRLDGRRVVRAADAAAPAALRHRRHAAAACLASSTREAMRRGAERRCTASLELDGHQVEAAGRTDGGDRPRPAAAPRASRRTAIDARADDVHRGVRARSTTSCARPTSRRGWRRASPRLLARAGGAPGRVPASRWSPATSSRSRGSSSRGRGSATGSRRARARSAPTPRTASALPPIARARGAAPGRASARSSSATRRATSPARGRTGCASSRSRPARSRVEALADADAVVDGAARRWCRSSRTGLAEPL